MNDTILVDNEHSGQRLDAFLAARLPQASRSRIQKLIKNGGITVNGKTAKPHLALDDGDEIALPTIETVDPDAPLEPRPDITLDIVSEDPAFVVIDKPSGLIVHPAVPGETETLANALIARYPEIRDVGESPDRPGIVHRLDKEASGLIVAARTPEAYAALKEQFQAHTILKEYTVLVHGSPMEDEGTVDFPIARLKGSGKMAAKPTGTREAREAVSHFTVDGRFPHATLLTVRTESGRTHQIRVHMKAMDMPVAGDMLYRKKGPKPLPVDRLFLHAKTLAFDHPVTGERLSFSSPLPEALENSLASLRKKGGSA